MVFCERGYRDIDMTDIDVSNVLKQNKVQVSLSNAVDPSHVMLAVVDLRKIY